MEKTKKQGMMLWEPFTRFNAQGVLEVLVEKCNSCTPYKARLLKSSEISGYKLENELDNYHPDDFVYLFEYTENAGTGDFYIQKTELIKAGTVGYGKPYHLVAFFKTSDEDVTVAGGKKRTRRSGTLVLNAKK